MKPDNQSSILIVEDDEITAELERKVLKRAGMKVHVVHFVRDALEVLQHHRFDAILLDFNLPDGDVWGIVDIADQAVPRIPVIIVTAHGNERIASEALRRGIADYMKKSDSFWDQLPDALDRVTRLARTEAALAQKTRELIRANAELEQQHAALQLASERMALATNSGGIGIWEYNLVTNTVRWDAWMYRLFGLPESDGNEPYTQWVNHLHPEDRMAAEQKLMAAISGNGDFNTEFRIIWNDGSVHYIRATAIVTRNSEGVATQLDGVNWDVTPLRKLSERLAQKNELLQVTLNSIGDAVITTDAADMVTWLNPVAERMTGWSNNEAMELPLQQVFHTLNDKSRVPVGDPVSLCLSQNKISGRPNHALLISRDGTEYGIEESAAPIRNDHGQVLGMVLVFRDVTEQRRLSGEMAYRATHDALTGLFNRVEFESRLRQTLVKVHENQSQHALMYIDLDQFKLVNDACGHTVGDVLLQQFAKLLAEVVRNQDMLARLGGDEFAVILEHCTSEQALRVAQKICDRMNDFRFIHEERRFRIGTSIGLVPLDSRWTTEASLMQAADTSCYAAKEAGRNRVHIWFDTDLAMRARHGEMQWASRLEQALDDNKFVLYAQRLFSINEKNEGLHAEVLLRMLDSDGSLVLPGVFLPAAERFNFASRIDRWVLHNTIALLSEITALSCVSRLSVNLSGQSVGDRAFQQQAIDALTTAGTSVCHRICVEITETAAITRMADAIPFIQQLRELGVIVALDDFGAGTSSFGYLKSLSIDILKIDGQFIKNLLNDPLDAATVRCFIDIAGVIKVRTVAEYIENAEVLEHLAELGVDYAQGYLLHRPEPLTLLIQNYIEDTGSTGISAGIAAAVLI